MWLLTSENALGLVLNSPTCSINLQAKVQKNLPKDKRKNQDRVQSFAPFFDEERIEHTVCPVLEIPISERDRQLSISHYNIAATFLILFKISIIDESLRAVCMLYFV